MAQQKATAKKITTAERRSLSIQLRLMGKTFEQIGEQLGITRQSAHALVMSELERRTAETSEAAETLRQLEIERMGVLLYAIMPTAVGGDIASVREVRAISERLARLQGLDAPNKSAISEIGNQTIIVRYEDTENR